MLFHSCLSHIPTPTYHPPSSSMYFSTIYFYNVIASFFFLTHINVWFIHEYVVQLVLYVVINMKLLFYIPVPSPSGFSNHSLVWLLYIHTKNISSQLTSVLLSMIQIYSEKKKILVVIVYGCDKMLWWCAMNIML